MGFTDETAILDALSTWNGDVEAAVTVLLDQAKAKKEQRASSIGTTPETSPRIQAS